MDRDIQRKAALLRQYVLEDVKRTERGAKNARSYLDIRYAAKFLGYRYEERTDLDFLERQLNPVAAAKQGDIVGLVDREMLLIAVSESIPPALRHLTAFHEVGHIVLHSDQLPRQHRDLAIGLDGPKPLMEREADQFAAAYTMPAKWVVQDVERRFGPVPIELTESVAWLLERAAPERLLNAAADDLLVEHRLATCTNNGSSQFDAVYDLYNVTAMAMALRLKELRVIGRG